MNFNRNLVALLVLYASLLQGQQTSTTQPQPQPKPCVVQAAPAPPKGIRFHIPDRLQQTINKQLGQVQKQTGLSIDPNQVIPPTPAPQPCQPVPPQPPQQKPN